MLDSKSKLKGSYVILFQIRKPARVKIGRLGTFLFPKGYYSYTGSAMKGLESRIQRHCSSGKKLHWHIDYLLAIPDVYIHKVYIAPSKHKNECQINQSLKSHRQAKILIPKFGSSDCKSGCKSHLLFWGQNEPKISGLNLMKSF